MKRRNLVHLETYILSQIDSIIQLTIPAYTFWNEPCARDEM